MENFLKIIGFIETRFGSLFSFRKKDRDDFFFVIGLFVFLKACYDLYYFYTYSWDSEEIDWAYLIITVGWFVTLCTFAVLLWRNRQSGVAALSFIFAYWLMLDVILYYQLSTIYGFVDSYPHYYEGEYHDVSYFNWSALRDYVGILKFHLPMDLFYFLCLRYFLKLQNRNELNLKESKILLLIVCGGGLAILFSSAEIISSFIF